VATDGGQVAVWVGINGMGRIGRAVLRGAIERSGSAVGMVAANELAPIATLAHLLRYDSSYGQWTVGIEIAPPTTSCP